MVAYAQRQIYMGNSLKSKNLEIIQCPLKNDGIRVQQVQEQVTAIKNDDSADLERCP